MNVNPSVNHLFSFNHQNSTLSSDPSLIQFAPSVDQEQCLANCVAELMPLARSNPNYDHVPEKIIYDLIRLFYCVPREHLVIDQFSGEHCVVWLSFRIEAQSPSYLKDLQFRAPAIGLALSHNHCVFPLDQEYVLRGDGLGETVILSRLIPAEIEPLVPYNPVLRNTHMEQMLVHHDSLHHRQILQLVRRLAKDPMAETRKATFWPKAKAVIRNYFPTQPLSENPAWQEFLQLLDQDAITTAYSMSEQGGVFSLYSYLKGHDLAQPQTSICLPEEVLRRRNEYRRQAVEMYPLLYSKYSYADHDLTTTIDSGKSLLIGFQKRWRMTPRWVWKHLKGKRPEDVGRFYSGHVERLPIDLCICSPNNPPQSPEDYDLLYELVYQLTDKDAGYSLTCGQVILPSLIEAGLKVGWDYVHRCIDTEVADVDYLSDYLDFLTSLAARIARELRPDECLMLNTIGRYLAQTLTLRQCRRLCDVWHERHHQILDDMHGQNNPSTRTLHKDRWAALTGDIKLEAGTIHEISNQEGLIREGQEMSHCVGSTQMRYISGAQRVYSLITNEGDRTTFSISMSRRAQEYYICEHRGPKNAKPGELSYQCANEFVAGLNSRSYEMNAGVIEEMASPLSENHVFPPDQHAQVNLSDDYLQQITPMVPKGFIDWVLSEDLSLSRSIPPIQISWVWSEGYTELTHALQRE